MDADVKKRLIACADLYETDRFMQGDPSWFMHQVEGTVNRETTAFVASCLSYGSRKLFMPKIQQLLDMAEGDLYQWICSRKYRIDIPDSPTTFYRLQTHHHMRQLFDALHTLFLSHRSLGNYLQSQAVSTATEALEALVHHFSAWDVGHLVPHTTGSSCKRVCMFLRWMVRDGSSVDLGLWTFIDKRTLLMPLDTHVLQEAARLKLISGKTASMRTAAQLTETLRQVFPDDPLKGDFALFGDGILNSLK